MNAPPVSDIERDPFGEAEVSSRRWRVRVLGVRFEFRSNNSALLALARDAFARTPAHLGRSASKTLRVDLQYRRDDESFGRSRPPKPRLTSGAGFLCAHVDARNFAICDPAIGRALIQVGDAMLRHPHLLRYELLEFVAITLATRARGLVSLHAACLGARGRGVLLLGSSGSGKSTLALHAALGGLDFLAEDSVFVDPASMRATGLSAFVHSQAGGVKLIEDASVRDRVRRSRVIERRSGVRKHEVDLRGFASLAPGPLLLVATVLVSSRRAKSVTPLEPLGKDELRRELRAEQSFAVGRPGWREFERRILSAGGYRLHRVPPAEGVAALRRVLAGRA